MTHLRYALLTLTGVVGTVTSLIAALGIWLLLTQPITVADAVSARDVAPIMRVLAGLLADAVWAVVRYL